MSEETVTEIPSQVKISEPGIYDIPAEAYHQDPAPEPSLSASIAHTLLSCSPWHAYHEHPRLNPGLVREEREIFDLGAAAHAYLLEGREAFVLIDAPDWRTKAAKEARDAAYLAGKTPLLQHRWDSILRMAQAVQAQLAAHVDGPIPLTVGRPERTLIWREGSVWCRARCDWLHDSLRHLDDLKTTGASAHPDQWTRTMFGIGADVQAAFYIRGLKQLTGETADFRFVVLENYEPFALSVIGLSPAVLMLAEKKVRYALELWGRCLESGSWPAYPKRTCYAELPEYEENRWLARELREAEGD